MEKKVYTLDIGGQQMSAEFNDWADQASGSRFMRREGRPSEEAVLSGRIVDRTIRPLFPEGMKRDVQVMITVLSIEDYDTDLLAVNAASLAIATSNIPWNGPVSAVRLELPSELGTRADSGSPAGEFIVNPTYREREAEGLRMDLLACGKDGLINMIEVGASEVSEETLEKALAKASEEIEKIQAWQREIIAEMGHVKIGFTAPEISPEIRAAFEEIAAPKMEQAVFGSNDGNIGKKNIYALKAEWIQAALEKLPDVRPSVLDHYYEEKINDFIHKEAIESGRRADGRKLDEIRPLFAQAGGLSPVVHGAGLFYRGATHVLGVLTLGGPGEAQLVDTIEYQESKKAFMLHYNFPPFSVGETGRVGGMNRRAIGHGALAEKALRAVLPKKDVFPYTIRIVCESLASNGSTSMASVCAGTLALMDAGVPIAKPVAGIAMGMMSDPKSGAYKILTDIQGPEDHHGDMDFKVAGTAEGVTAVQMDVKVEGVPLKVLAEAFNQAKAARMQILQVITNEIPAPRADISPRAPKILTTHVKVDQIGLVIGPGGKTINGIKERTKCDEITIEDDGTVFVTGRNGTAEAALKEIEELTHEFMVGDRFEGPVVRLMDFGAFVKIGPNNDGLVHVSEVAPFRIGKISDAVQLGEVVPVVIKEIDEKGRYNLSIKAADPEWAARKGLTPSAGGEQHGERRRDDRPRR